MNSKFRRYAGSLSGPALAITLITPSDDTPVPRGVRLLRIFNNTDTPKNLSLTPFGNCGISVDLPIPPLTLVWEEIMVSYVRATGTGTGLVIHGYSD